MDRTGIRIGLNNRGVTTPPPLGWAGRVSTPSTAGGVATLPPSGSGQIFLTNGNIAAVFSTDSFMIFFLFFFLVQLCGAGKASSGDCEFSFYYYWRWRRYRWRSGRVTTPRSLVRISIKYHLNYPATEHAPRKGKRKQIPIPTFY